MNDEWIAERLRAAIEARGAGGRARTPTLKLSPQSAGGRRERILEKLLGSGLPEAPALTRAGAGNETIPLLIWDRTGWSEGELGA